MPSSGRPRVFISYARKEGASRVQQLQADLEKQGFDAWLDEQHIEGGATRTTKIERGARQRRVRPSG